jgi:HEAT repeat protein
MGVLQRLFGPNIGKLADNGDVAGLCSVVQSEAATELRTAAVGALAGFDDDGARATLAAALSDPEPSLASAAKAALRQHGAAAAGALVGALGGVAGEPARAMLVGLGEAGVEPLQDACSDGDEAAREHALAGLLELDRELGTPEVRETVFRTLLASLGDRSPGLRSTAAETLAELRDPRAGRALAAQLKDGQEEVREACRRALAALGETAVLHVADALSDSNLNARRLAAGILVDMDLDDLDLGTRTEVLKALLRRVDERDPELREAVARALEKVPADDVVATKLEYVAEPESANRDEALEYLRDLLEHAAISDDRRSAAVERLRGMGHEIGDRQ